MKHNLPAVASYLYAVVDSLELERSGAGQRAAEVQAERIEERYFRQQGSDGEFAANRGEYGRAKRAMGIPVGIGLYDGFEVGSGRPGQRTHLLGDVDIDGDRLTMRHGADELVALIGAVFDQGRKDGSQPPRPFYAVTEEDADALIDRVFLDMLDDAIRGV